MQPSEKSITPFSCRIWLMPCLVFSAFFVACDSDKPGSDDRKPTALQRDQMSRLDRWAVESPVQTSMEAAVIRQRVLYEYHFEQGSARLTPLGRRDIGILARHFGGEDWVLSVRQGGAGLDLYNARVQTVRDQLSPLGVAVEQVTIVDAQPGGIGMAANDARRIRKKSIEGAESLDVGDGMEDTEVLTSPSSSPQKGGS